MSIIASAFVITKTKINPHTPRWVLVLPVDADGLAPAVPLVVVEKSPFLEARHVVMSVRLHCRDWRERMRWKKGRIIENDYIKKYVEQGQRQTRR